jgi:hypothetical protein
LNIALWEADMSRPVEPPPVKLIVSLFSPSQPLLDESVEALAGPFGPIDWVSPPFMFDRTMYYAREMGWPLHRRFVSFRDLVAPECLPEIKIETNALEERYLTEGRRRVNIDPGYVALERLVLATGKNYVHRIYLSRGIYADLTLVFSKGSFSPLPWTYPDYAAVDTIGYFNQVRADYLAQLKGGNRL